MIANLLLYLYQLAAARGLGPEEYSLFGALFGIVYLTSGLPNALQVAIARFVARSLAGAGSVTAGQLTTYSLFLSLLLGCIVLGIVGATSPLIGSDLHSDSLVPVVITGVIICLFMLVPVVQGALQGAQRFLPFVVVMLVYAGSRLAFGLGALGMDWGVMGMLAAAGLSALVTVIIGLAIVRPSLRVSAMDLPIGAFIKVFVPALIGAVAFTFPSSADVFIVRHFFPAREAGLYAGASILGKTVLYMPMVVSTVLFPKITREWAQGGGGRGLLYRGLGLTALMSGGVCLVFVLLPGLASRIFLGSEYVGAQDLVPLYATAMFLFSLSIMFLHYHLATGRATYFYGILLPHLLLQVVLIYVFHESLIQVLLVLLSLNVSLVVCSQAFTQIATARALKKGKD